MPDSPAPTSQPPPRRPRRRWLRWIIIPLLVAITSCLLTSAIKRHKAPRELDAAIAETDALDPGWRLESIEQSRQAIVPDENAAIPVLEAAALIPESWTKQTVLDEVAATPPQRQLDSALLEPLSAAIAQVSGALPRAEKTIPLRSGRFHIEWAPDAFSTLVPHLSKVRTVCTFLGHAATQKSAEGQHDEAWTCTVAMLGVSRSIGDEPLAISQLVRIFGRTSTVRSFERCLGQGSIADHRLAQAQDELTRELSHTCHYCAIRGERATLHSVFNCLEDDKMPQLSGLAGRENWGLLKRIDFFLAGSTFMEQHAWTMRYMNDAVECSKSSPPDQLVSLNGLMNRHPDPPPLSKALIGAFTKVAEADARSVAVLRATLAALAAERFRLAHNRWPESLAELVSASFLDKVPEDPFNGKTLRYRKTPDGVVLYSVGPYFRYAGDALDAGREYNPDLFRYEFRLWDEAHRRQPPRESKK